MEQHRATSDEEKDAAPSDAQFGRAASEDADRADQMSVADAEEEDLARRTEGGRDDIRAGNKAPVDGDGPSDDEKVDEESEDSFPASDAPANY